MVGLLTNLSDRPVPAVCEGLVFRHRHTAVQKLLGAPASSTRPTPCCPVEANGYAHGTTKGVCSRRGALDLDVALKQKVCCSREIGECRGGTVGKNVRQPVIRELPRGAATVVAPATHRVRRLKAASLVKQTGDGINRRD